jgi:Predicted metal-dependent hydrolase of the TIM-barrel fold
MKIIDAHMHFSENEGFHKVARAARHENTSEHLVQAFRENGIVMGIAMGTHPVDPDPALCSPSVINLSGMLDHRNYNQPGCIVYCAGVDDVPLTPENREPSLAAFEELLGTGHCVGIKLYPGYHAVYPGDRRNYPFYELAERYDVPVVFHSGDTASSRGLLKYSHPLEVDEVAVAFPRVRFVIAHYGSPWIVDATEVAIKKRQCVH